MKALAIIGALAVVFVMSVGAWYLTNNLTMKKGRRK